MHAKFMVSLKIESNSSLELSILNSLKYKIFLFSFLYWFVVMLPIEYFAESINSDSGFYGYRCDSYFGYVFGWCNLKQKERSKLRLNRIKMGEHCEQTYVIFLGINSTSMRLNADALKLQFHCFIDSFYSFFLLFLSSRTEGIVFVSTHKKAPYAMG